MNFKIVLVIMLSIAYQSSLLAQTDSDFQAIYPAGKIPNTTTGKVTLKEESVIGQDGKERISGVSIPTMRYYAPDKSKSKGSAIIICPGGGYSILAMSHEGHEIAKKFAENGIAAFVLKYRLPSDVIMADKSIGPLQDVQQAFKVVREQAAAYGIKPNKIGIIGFSAGGHLASSAGVHYNDIKIENLKHTSLRPDFMLLLYPVISMDTTITHGGSRNNLLGKQPDEALVKYFSNETQITKDTPPTLLVHAEDDKAVPIANSKRFYDALQKNNISSKLITYPQGGHGFGLNNKTTNDKWFDHALVWLHQEGF
ncbi:MAG TPA: alpha/beta hydrolase [Pseudosphingobacterium sp.]|nr:alpha/beta hydrolase [Pseudosphingobacterium sp.]